MTDTAAKHPRAGSRKTRRRLFWAGLISTLLAGATIALLGFTPLGDGPAACNICHEIQPQCQAFATGPHNPLKIKQDITCLDCHSAPGAGGRIAAKLDGAKFLIGHLQGKTPSEVLSPSAEQTVENSCVRCHGDYDATAKHPPRPRGSKACLSCHSYTGHPLRQDAE